MDSANYRCENHKPHHAPEGKDNINNKRRTHFIQVVRHPAVNCTTTQTLNRTLGRKEGSLKLMPNTTKRDVQRKKDQQGGRKSLILGHLRLCFQLLLTSISHLKNNFRLNFAPGETKQKMPSPPPPPPPAHPHPHPQAPHQLPSKSD